tara:strand:+ start:25963 stop:26589 length:627 start_codon:yes stop_codon:yes gene_type:complete
MGKLRLEDISLEDIYDFIENGNPTDADPAVVEYLELMDKIRGMYLRFDKFGSKDHIVNHLIKVDGFSRYLANNLYNDTLEYFYCENKISKDAWRNICLEKMEKVANLAMMLIKDVADAAKVHKMWVDMNNSMPEAKETLPEEWFLKPWKMYAMDAELVGLPNVDRPTLAKHVDSLPELSEKEREMIKREAAVLPIKIFPDEQENARKL